LDNKVKELYYMCRDNNFAIARANELIGEIDVNEPIHYDPDREQHITTFLSEACSNTNLKMAKLLLEHGADPNYVLYTDQPGWQENPFWDLQYPVYNDKFYNENDENKKIADAADADNLEIARLCLEHGANPCIKLDGEDLFSWVFYAVVADEDDFRLLEYRSKFLILLIAYGGKNKYYEYEIIKPFDKNNMNQYDFVRFGSNPYSVDEIVDEHYEVVARIRHRKEKTDE
jgi:ankyrin repeat protein